MSSRRERIQRRLARQERPQAEIAVGLGAGNVPVEAREKIEGLLASGDEKSALKRAKQLFEAQPSPQTQDLLLSIYRARVATLRERGLVTEARSLEDLVRERFPSAAVATAAQAMASQDLTELLTPLADPSLSSERRAAIEEQLRRTLEDPRALADCPALPEDHPLRTAAREVAAAFVAVTSGPVAEEVVALPQVSRRGALAPWKLLVRAIAAMYRKDDAACRQALSAIESDSPPARLVPAVETVLFGRPVGPIGPASLTLAKEVSLGPEALLPNLAALDAALEAGKRPAVSKLVPAVLERCSALCPELAEPLRQRISIRCLLADIPLDEARKSLGGYSRRDATWYRLMGRANEHRGDVLQACVAWDAFLILAKAEGWFPRRGPEAAAVYLRMLAPITSVPHTVLLRLRQSMAKGPVLPALDNEAISKARRALGRSRTPAKPPYFLFPRRLFARACQADPDTENFARWLSWARDTGADRDFEVACAASAWLRSKPSDKLPAVQLMRLAEKHGHFPEAAEYLEQAERADSLDPQLRRLRVRLLAEQTLHLLKKKKKRLAVECVRELRRLPQSLEGDRPALAAALAHLAALDAGDSQSARAELDETCRLLGGERAAEALLFSLAVWSGRKAGAASFPKSTAGPELIGAIARVRPVLDEVSLPPSFSGGWTRAIKKTLKHDGANLDGETLLALLQACNESPPMAELAYLASGLGLRKGGDGTARFLLERSRCVANADEQRGEDCLRAAFALARRRRDMELVEEIVEEWHELTAEEKGLYFDSMPSNVEEELALDDRELDQLLRFEQQAPKPRARKRSGARHGRPGRVCPDCDEVHDGSELEFLDCDDEDDEYEIQLDTSEQKRLEEMTRRLAKDLPKTLPPGHPFRDLPPELLALMMEAGAKYGTPDGSMPDMAAVARRDPGLMSRIARELEKLRRSGRGSELFEDMNRPKSTRKGQRRP